MNLGKYINKLLLEHETLIIPGFGAFISSYKPSQIDVDYNEIIPPSKIISFNPKIKHNDGVLVNEIVESEHISYPEALTKIEQERDDIIYRLDKEEKVTLKNTGILFYDKNHEIQFEPSLKENLLLDAFGLEATSLKDEIINSPEEISDTENVPEKEKPKKVENSEEHGSKTAVQGQEQKKEPAHVSESTFQEPEQPPDKKRRSWLWYLLILIPLIAGGIFILKKEKKKLSPSMEITTEPPSYEDQIPYEQTRDERSASLIDTTETDTLKVAVTDTVKTAEEKIDSTAYITPDPSKFYLVGGSFKNPENADKYFQQMKSKGYEPFHLGKQGNFYIVGIAVYDNEIEAYGAQYDFLDKYPDSGVWVFIPE